MEQRRLQRRSAPMFWACFLPIFALSLFAWWRYGIREEREEAPISGIEGNEFNFDTPRADAPAPASKPFVTQFEMERMKRLGAPGGAGSGLTHLVPESRPRAEAPAQDPKRDKEKEFIRTFDPMIRAEQRKLRRIIKKHHKKYAVVRRFDKEVQGMPRVMELGRRYHKDRDFYQWARDVVQLPEFRGLVMKYATDMEAWKAGTSMVLEALKAPPPPPVYTELLKLFTEDPVVSRHTPEMMSTVLANLPGMIVQSIPKGESPELLQGFASELVPNGGATLGLVDSSRSNAYWQGYKVGFNIGYQEGRAKAAARAKK